MKKVIDRVLKIVSAILLLGGVTLGFLSYKYMGVQRSLYYRNEMLQDKLFDFYGVSSLLLVGGLFFWTVWRKKEKLSSVDLAVFRVSVGFLLLCALLYTMTSFMGAPWILLGGYIYYVSVSIEIVNRYGF